MLTILFAHYRNGTRNFNQINKNINELSDNTSDHVADVLAGKCASIRSVSYLYGNAIKSTDVDLELLAGLEERSRFDMIRFIAVNSTRLPVIREILDRQTDYYIEYDALVEGKTYKRSSLMIEKVLGDITVLYLIRESGCQKSTWHIYLKSLPVKTVQPRAGLSVQGLEWQL